MRNNERGVTLIGWVIILAIIGIFALAALRLVPIYMESLKVSSVLRSVEKEHDGNRATVQQLRKSIRTRFDVEAVNIIKYSDVEITQIGNGGYRLRASYEHKTPFVGNLGLVVTIDHRVEIER